LSEGERKMLVNLLSFGELRVDDVMVPRADIVAVEIGTPLSELAAIFRDAQHSRLPIYRETLDDPVGMVHIKDVLALLVPAAGEPQAGENVLQRLRRDTLFVPPSMRVMDLLIKMQKSRIHMALVIDEYGGTDGLVTIEDLIEEIVGDIEDEHDVEETALIAARPDGGFDVNGRIPIEDLEQVLGHSLALPGQEEEIDTLGGLVFSLVGRVPLRGELISHPGGFEFEILDADPRRVKKVRVHRLVAQAPGESAGSETPEEPRGEAEKDKRSA
jgi:CBS domain containing-hemolysin-like protein